MVLTVLVEFGSVVAVFVRAIRGAEEGLELARHLTQSRSGQKEDSESGGDDQQRPVEGRPQPLEAQRQPGLGDLAVNAGGWLGGAYATTVATLLTRRKG